MAGWKLRKDKTPAEEPGAEFEADAPAEEATPTALVEDNPAEHSQQEPVVLEAAPAFPEFDADTDFQFTDLDFDSDFAPLTQDDAALKLVDYTEPITVSPPEVPEPESPKPEAQAVPEFQPLESPAPPVFEIPIPAAPALPLAAADAPPEKDFLPRLQTGPALPFEPVPVSAPVSANGLSRSGVPDFASGFGSGIPAVAPFVLDTPAPAAPPAAAPQLIVRIGRLSAAYPLVKEITTIGRPDSALHYYPDIEIEMDDAISRRHAEIIKHADSFCLIDTGSTNGTLLNGEMLPPHEERLLARGDRIRLGDRTEIIFE